MADSLASSVQIKMAAKQVNTIDSSGTTTTVDALLNYNEKIVDGTSVNQADKLWVQKGIAIGSGNTKTIEVNTFSAEDIGTGTGEDATGTPITLAEIVSLGIVRDSNSVGTLEITPHATNGWTSFLKAAGDIAQVLPRAYLCFGTLNDPAYAVAANNKNVNFSAVGGAVTFDLMIFGRSS